MVYHLFKCPTHGILSEREGDDAIEGHDGTFFGSHPGAEDGYTGEYFCPLPVNPYLRESGECHEKLEQISLREEQLPSRVGDASL